ncbi:hypothetical protein D5S18_28845 [Nocardia panacis]|uniref:Uncharacterized protein n=2 Tax=Nocardia panacis TaxID=2340916 RepID=A0A3A4KBA6_9NOCA|nr:hypothetical protein D5S18_28845 [Nocardia panacis]
MNPIFAALVAVVLAVVPVESARADPPPVGIAEVELGSAGVDLGPVEVPRGVVVARAVEPVGATFEQLLVGMQGAQVSFEPDAEQFENAWRIVDIVRQRQMPARAAVIALATATQESSLRNLTVAVDHDSLGLFQQRPSEGWGPPERLIDPGFATNAFLDALERAAPDYGSIPLWQAAQATQRSAFPTAYARWHEQSARLVLRMLAGE